jgi:hypothetical protein
MDDWTIGTLPKNSREAIAIMLRTYKGHQFCDVRVMVVDGATGKTTPTGKGVAIKPDSLPALIELLKDAHMKAQAAGWCSDDAGEA